MVTDVYTWEMEDKKIQNRTISAKKAWIEALEKCLGNVTMASKMLNMSRNTHYTWMNEDEDYRNEVNSLDDLVLDFAESQLHKKIKNGDTTAIIFFMKTKGKRRGYVERQEVSQVEPIKIVISDDI
jgi:hypothetical protein